MQESSAKASGPADGSGVDASGINIQRYLDENSAMLNEWEKLLSSPAAKQPANAQRHALYRKKLHENLTLLAKLADQQTKAAKAVAAQPTSRQPARQPSQAPAAQAPSMSLSSLPHSNPLVGTGAAAARLGDLTALQALQMSIPVGTQSQTALNAQTLRLLQSQNQALAGLSTLPPHIAAAVQAKMQSMQQQQQQQHQPSAVAAPAPQVQSPPQQQKGVKRPLP